jgi:hypothetical protein
MLNFKNWSKRKKIIVGVIVLIVIGVGSNQSVETNSSSSSSSSRSISLSEATRIAKKKCQGSGQCQFCDVYQKVENQSGNYGIFLSCGGGPADFLSYEISKSGNVISAEFSN